VKAIRTPIASRSVLGVAAGFGVALCARGGTNGRLAGCGLVFPAGGATTTVSGVTTDDGRTTAAMARRDGLGLEGVGAGVGRVGAGAAGA